MGDIKLKKIFSIFIFLFLLIGICFTGYLAFTDDSHQKSQKNVSEKKDSTKAPKKDKDKDKNNKDSTENNQNAETEASIPTEQNYGADYNNQTAVPDGNSYNNQNVQNPQSTANTLDASVENNTEDNSGYAAQQEIYEKAARGEIAEPGAEVNSGSSVPQ